jgi:hypothetical protein
MAHWTESINLSHLHRLYDKGDINIPQLGKAVAKRLQLTSFFHTCEPEFIDIICEFDALDEFSELKDYEVALDLLYDFGDKGIYAVDGRYNNLWVITNDGADKPDEDDELIHKPIKTVDVNEGQTTFYGPYKNEHNQSSYITPSTVHSRSKSTKVTRYLSPADFNKRLEAHNVKPDSLPKEMYEYIKDADDQYQAWLIECLPNLRVAEIKPIDSTSQA